MLVPTDGQLDREGALLAERLDRLTRRLDAPYLSEHGRRYRDKTAIRIDKDTP